MGAWVDVRLGVHLDLFVSYEAVAAVVIIGFDDYVAGINAEFALIASNLVEVAVVGVVAVARVVAGIHVAGVIYKYDPLSWALFVIKKYRYNSRV